MDVHRRRYNTTTSSECAASTVRALVRASVCVPAVATRDSQQFNIILSYGLFCNYCILVIIIVERGYIIHVE